MSRLSEYLDYLLTQKDISKYVLAKKIGIDNSSFYKMLSGQRKISYHIFEQILKYVSLTYEEKKELNRLYKIMTIGEDKWRSRQKILQFIQALNEDEEDISFYHKADLSQITPGNIKGRKNLSRVISSLIFSEIHQGSDLKIICQTNFSFLYDTLKLVESKKNLKIEQILCFENSGQSQTIDNIQILSVIAPLFRSSFSYEPYYFYGNSSSYCGSMTLFPFLILGEHAGVLFSSDCENGIVFTDSAILSTLSERFKILKHRAEPLLMSLSDTANVQTKLAQQKLFPNKEIYVLCPNVFFSNHCNTDFWVNLLKEDLPDRQDLTELMRKERAQVQKQASINQVYSYFTREGLMDFWNNGHVIDVLADYYKPISKEDRHMILQKTLEDIKSDRLKGRLFRKNVLSFARDFYLIMQSENTVNCILRKRNGTFVGIHFQENTLCEGMEDFLINLDEELLESKEVTMEFFRQLLQI